MLVSFLYPYHLRNIEAPHLWFFYYQLQNISDEEIIYIGSEEYFYDYSNTERRELDNKLYSTPTNKRLKNLNKVIIDKSIFLDLESELVSSTQVWKKLICERYLKLEEILEKEIIKIINKYEKIEGILATCNCPSLNYIAHKYGIKVIYSEVGALRPPLFQSTAYLDFSGVNGNTEFDKRYDQFLEEIANEDFNYQGIDNLVELLGTNILKENFNEKVNEEYKLGVAFQVEGDSNVLSYSNNYTSYDLCLLANKNFNKNEILLRKHPESSFEVSNKFGVIDDYLINVNFLRKSKIIMAINSSLVLEALFFDKHIITLGDSSFKTFSSESFKKKKKLDVKKLEFYCLGYLIPFELMYSTEYIRFRLRSEDQTEIYKFNLNYWKNKKDRIELDLGIDKIKIISQETERINELEQIIENNSLQLSKHQDILEIHNITNLELENEIQKEKEEKLEIEKNIDYLLKKVDDKTQELNLILNSKAELENEIQKEKEEKLEIEKNIDYLLKKVDDKTQELNLILNSKAWKIIRKYRNSITRIKNYKNKIISFSNKKKKYSNIMDEGLITVVIPIYNREKELIESIESILNQTYQNIELILVCDGSPEATLNIVREYEKNPKVRAFYYSDNSGNAVRGRNKAIREAKGKYLAFQDSDDIAEVDRLENSLFEIKNSNADVIYGGWRAKLEGTRDIQLEDGQEVFSPDCDYELLKQICVPCQSTVMARIEPLRKVGGLKPKMKYREDHELWLRLAYNGYKFKAIQRVLTNLRLHDGNLELSFKNNDEYWERLMLEEYKINNKFKPKVAYLIEGCDISGGLLVICEHVNRLYSYGFDVILIAKNGNSINWFKNLKVPIVTLDNAPDNIDILVATYWMTAYTALKIPAKKRYYFIQSDESKFYPKDSPDSKKAYESYKLNLKPITMAKWIQKWLKKEFGKDALYIPIGIDEELIHETTPLVKKTDKVRILIEGPANIPFKAVDESFEVVKDVNCEVWYVNSGGIPKKEWKYDKYFEKVPIEQMKYIYSSCDILLKLSRVESFSLPALEMMACGGISIVNNFMGAREFIVDGYNALIVDVNNLEEVKTKLLDLINNREKIEELKKNSKETIKDWGWEKSIKDLSEEFIKVTDNNY